MEAVKTMKKRFSPLFYSCLFAFTSILSFPQLALAQLRLGTGVQPGLEGYFLEYQQRGLPLNELRGASGCAIGFGASCNKTGAILQKIVQKHSGLDYQQLLVKAAGGAENYQKFVQIYANQSAVPLVPYSSFWRDGNKYILDSHEYAGINTFNSAGYSGLNEITSKFHYSPISLRNEIINLRQGAIGLKVSYGVTLMEEALKVPNINQEIAEVSLNESEASFHQQHFQNAVWALNRESSGGLKNALFNVLSSPYTAVPAPLNRPNLQISNDITQVETIALEGDIQKIVAITEGRDETALSNSLDEVIDTAATSGYAIAGLGGAALLLLLLSGEGGSDGGGLVASIDNIVTPEQLLSEENVTPRENPSPPTIRGENQGNNNNGGVDVLEIPEPSNQNSFFFLLFILFLFSRKKVMV